MDIEDIIATCVKNTANSSNTEKLGIYRFAKMFFPNIFNRNFSEVHYIMAELLFKLHDPSKEYVMQKQAYFMVHREAAKTTIGSFLFPTYLLYLKGHDIYVRSELLGWNEQKKEDFKQYMINDDIVRMPINESFIVIASQTLRRAEGFISSIKTTIESRSDLAKIFGDKDPRVIEDYEDRRRTHKMWRVNSFITSDDTIIWAIGAGQHTRGLNINGKRPTLIIADDIYSQDNTKTEQSRQQIEYWFDAELLNSADSREGKVLMLGTLVHPDTVFKDIVNSKNWYGVNRPIISEAELKALVNICTKDGNFIVPELAECNHLDDGLRTLSWRDHKGSYFILNKYYEYLKKNKLDNFYQEFMNNPLAPETLMISPDSFVKTHMKVYKENSKQMVEFIYDNMKWKGELNLYIGLDIASSFAQTSDDTVIMVAGYARCWPSVPGYDLHYLAKDMPRGKVFPIIVHIEGGKYSVTDYQQRPGMTESLMRRCTEYLIQQINAETQGQQEQIVREIRKNFEEPDVEAVALRKRVLESPRPLNITIFNETTNMNKKERILSILLPIIQRHKIVLYNDRINEVMIDRLYSQLLTVGFADHDDFPDAYAITMKHAIPPEIDDKLIRDLTGNVYHKITDNREMELIAEYGDDWMYYY